MTILTVFCQVSFAAHYHDDVAAYPPWKSGRDLGELSLTVTTDNAEARDYFLTGLKLVHTYEFPEAMWCFKEAQKLDPGFAMAYWGEMVASQMLVWNTKVPEQARNAYERLQEHADVNSLSELEKGLIKATQVLFAEDPEHRDPFEKGSSVWKFRRSMAELHKRHPESMEIRVWYGYSILGTRRGSRDFSTNLAAVLHFREVLEDNPRHPGALHYMLHATENPRQSYLGVQAATTLGDVASASIHALHMPAHYYYTLADWDKVVDINVKAWLESKIRAEERGLSEDSAEFHGFGWIVYALLQQGKEREARQKLMRLYRLYERGPSPNKLKYLLFARAGFLVDTPVDSEERKAIIAASLPHPEQLTAALAADIFANAYVAFQSGDEARVQEGLAEYKHYMKQDLRQIAPPERDAIRVLFHLLKGLKSWVTGDLRDTDSILAEASRMEDRMVHEHGIPLVVKPANELYGDFLLQQGKQARAVTHYQRALEYHPGRIAIFRAWTKVSDK